MPLPQDNWEQKFDEAEEGRNLFDEPVMRSISADQIYKADQQARAVVDALSDRGLISIVGNESPHKTSIKVIRETLMKFEMEQKKN